MNKKEILEKIKTVEGLTNDERAYLVNLVNTKKKYGLVWEDKPEDVEEELRTKLPILKEVKERAIVNDTETEKHPNHILIEGDNLHVLTALTFTHEGKIDVIYIDPPYNTGEDDFRYNDTFVEKEDSYRHSKWLSFMAKRMTLAKRLLSKTGVLICHIDENEHDNLSVLLREVFGEQNNLGTIIWNKRNPKGDAKGVAVMHEYIICYAKNKTEFLELGDTIRRKKPNGLSILRKAKSVFNKLNKTSIPTEVEEILKAYDYPKNLLDQFKVKYDMKLVNREFDSWLKRTDFSEGEKAYKFLDQVGEPFQPVSMAWPNKKTAPDDYHVPLYHPTNGTVAPIPDKGWRNPSSTMEKLLGEDDPIELLENMVIKGEVCFTVNRDGENNQPRRKYLLRENLDENTPSILDYGGSDDSFFNTIGIDFPYAKPLEVAEYLLSSIHPSPSIILDFFAGTGPALHATMSINKKEVQCILATNNENGIADDCYARNKKAIEGYEVKKKKATEKIEGLKNNNLRYYQCGFVEREPSLANKRQLTQLATELLCIKEDCYQEATSQINTRPSTGSGQAWNKLFTNGKGQFVYVVYDDLYIEEAVTALAAFVAKEAPESKVQVYVFANGQYAYAEEFEDIAENITLAALPDAIYKAYQNVLPKQNREFVPQLDEEVDVEPEMDFDA